MIRYLVGVAGCLMVDCPTVQQKVNARSSRLSHVHAPTSWFGNTWTPSSTPGQSALAATTRNYFLHFGHIGTPPRMHTLSLDALVPHCALQISRTSTLNSGRDCWRKRQRWTFFLVSGFRITPLTNVFTASSLVCSGATTKRCPNHRYGTGNPKQDIGGRSRPLPARDLVRFDQREGSGCLVCL